MVIASSFYERYWKQSLPRSANERSVFVKDKKYALDAIGADSMYSFFLSKSWFDLITALVVVIPQVVALFLFVQAAVNDFKDEISDFIYSQRCPRNSVQRANESDFDWEGCQYFGF